MGSLSRFSFTKGEFEVENVIRMAQRKFLMAYLKITSMGTPDLRMEGKAIQPLCEGVSDWKGDIT